MSSGDFVQFSASRVGGSTKQEAPAQGRGFRSPHQAIVSAAVAVAVPATPLKAPAIPMPARPAVRPPSIARAFDNINTTNPVVTAISTVISVVTGRPYIARPHDHALIARGWRCQVDIDVDECTGLYRRRIGDSAHSAKAKQTDQCNCSCCHVPAPSFHGGVPWHDRQYALSYDWQRGKVRKICAPEHPVQVAARRADFQVKRSTG